MAKKSYSVAEARAKLPSILNDVGAGDEVYLTRRGQPAAVVLSTQAYEALRSERTTFSVAYRQFLSRHGAPEGGVGFDRAFIDSLRDRGAGRRARL